MELKSLNISRGGQAYEAPSAEVIDIVAEQPIFQNSGYDSPGIGNDNDLGTI